MAASHVDPLTDAAGFLVMVPKTQWVPDSASSLCQRCAERFTFFRRRHHCRCCGQLVCDKCTTRAACRPFAAGAEGRDGNPAVPGPTVTERVCLDCTEGKHRLARMRAHGVTTSARVRCALAPLTKPPSAAGARFFSAASDLGATRQLTALAFFYLAAREAGAAEVPPNVLAGALAPLSHSTAWCVAQFGTNVVFHNTSQRLAAEIRPGSNGWSYVTSASLRAGFLYSSGRAEPDSSANALAGAMDRYLAGDKTVFTNPVEINGNFVPPPWLCFSDPVLTVADVRADGGFTLKMRAGVDTGDTIFAADFIHRSGGQKLLGT